MSFSAKGRLIYLAHPRTASRATERALLKCLKWRSKQTKNCHAKLDEIEWKNGDEKVITTIRNPLDLIASWWAVNPALHDKATFLEFVKTYHHSMMVVDDRLFYFIKDCDRYLIFEDLQLQFDIAMKEYGFPTTKIPMTNVTKNKDHFMTYHTQETIDAMWDRFPIDMELYHVR